ncbi:putative endonuclease [Christiangramia gaetbulicola]|uniref:Putative endonuclease n=1 Tax=Christiangramia gaetbulicola TaxID=703340 RepID=A0A2T6ADM7_9FLAO|nr:GIY-YIG nuclease family protein [Christiangramia gaetbulicola]PTX41924.1 putative endonuclease [Christiangramia gaetbulicola]
MPFHLYILFSKKLDRFYVGATGNLQKRLEKHLSSSSGFTSKVRDWTIIYSEEYERKEDAFKREKQIKLWKSRKMIEALIDKEV